MSSEFSLEIREIPTNAAIGPYRYADEFAWKVKWYKFNQSKNKLFNLVPVSLTIRPTDCIVSHHVQVALTPRNTTF